MKSIPLILLVAVTSGCTAVTVRPVTAAHKIKHVAIRENPKVIVTDFLPVLKDGFNRHGISTETIAPDTSANRQYVVTYTALRSWDFVPYLSHAEIRIEKDGAQVAYAEYHLRGKGGYSMLKWQGVKKKMDPVIDKLLANSPH
jgi:hypothetical protein